MASLIYIGSILAVIGVVGLGYSIALAFGIRREGAGATDVPARMQRLSTINMASLAFAGLGLSMVVIGMLL